MCIFLYIYENKFKKPFYLLLIPGVRFTFAVGFLFQYGSESGHYSMASVYLLNRKKSPKNSGIDIQARNQLLYH